MLKVDSFLNHQIDVPFISELGKEFKKLFGDRQVDKILTIEASGIGIACLTAVYFGVPVLFAKKSAGSNMDKDVYATEVKSFTHNKVNHVVASKKYLNAGEHILIMDDFLANGCAVQGLIDLVKQAGGICPKLVSPGFDGMPDRMVLLPNGKIGFVEVKATGEKPRLLQFSRHRLLRRLGFLVYVLDDAEQIGGMLDEIQTP